MSYHMRCSRGKKGCGTRFTLAKPPWRYKREVRCPFCSTGHVLDLEKQRQAEFEQRNRHVCAGYPFPHEVGTLRMCSEHLLIEEPLTYEEQCEYDQVINTPRGATT